MAIFDKAKLEVISTGDNLDLSKATINKNLSAVGFDSDDTYFYMTIDRILFSNPVSTIKTVLDTQGFVPNLENILSCMDSFVFSVYSRVSDKGVADTLPVKVNEYLPCIRFDLPQKNKVGGTLQSFYDEISKYESSNSGTKNTTRVPDPEIKRNRDLNAQIKQLKETNKELQAQLNAMTYQLSLKQKSLSRASRALDSQQVLPDNAKICRVEQVNLKQRMVKVKCFRKLIDIPTHMLDRVPEFQARCLITFDEGEDVPVGIVFFDNEELGSLEKRIAELLYVEGDIFKARDSMRNEFQIKAVNAMEAETIRSLTRGMKVVISIADGYVVRFAVLAAGKAAQFTTSIEEQFIVYDLARNQLVKLTTNDDTP